MIVIEGPQNSGKTTLANRLSTVFDLPVYFPMKDALSKELIKESCNFVLDNHNKYIFDRVPFISEPIYCLLRHEGNLLLEEKELYKKFDALMPVMIYCRPPDNYILDQKKLGIKDYDTPKYIKEVMIKHGVILNLYDKVMNTLPNIRYDYTGDGFDNLVEKIKNEMVRMDGYKNEESPADDRSVKEIQNGAI